MKSFATDFFMPKGKVLVFLFAEGIFFFLNIELNHVYSSPQCTLKLSCKTECVNLLNNGVSVGTLIGNDDTDNENYKQYTKTFDCQPGNVISFDISGLTGAIIPGTETEYTSGFIAELIMVGDPPSSPNQLTFKSYQHDPITIFTCEPTCSLKEDEKVKFNGETDEHSILEYSGTIQIIRVTITMPYKLDTDNFVDKENDNIIYSDPNIFQFKDYIKPYITGANIDGLLVKLTEIPSNENAILSKVSNPSVSLVVGDQVSLGESLQFKRVGDYFGLIELKYEIISQESLGTKSIKFNICYKFCANCDEYPVNPSSKQCTSCDNTKNIFFIDDTVNNIESDRCFHIDEINEDFKNYYLDTAVHKYKICDESCKTCVTSNENCQECNILYYFVEDLSDISLIIKQCYSLHR